METENIHIYKRLKTDNTSNILKINTMEKFNVVNLETGEVVTLNSMGLMFEQIRILVKQDFYTKVMGTTLFYSRNDSFDLLTN
jgi:hypothetical protein